MLLLEVFCTLSTAAICRQVQRQLIRNELTRFYHHRIRNYMPSDAINEVTSKHTVGLRSRSWNPAWAIRRRIRVKGRDLATSRLQGDGARGPDLSGVHDGGGLSEPRNRFDSAGVNDRPANSHARDVSRRAPISSRDTRANVAASR
jgi:hypothetical protein